MKDYEMLLESFYLSLLRAGDLAIDVGAHVGRHTVPMARAVAPGGHVFAFEPLPWALPQLRKAIADAAVDATVRPYALGNHEGSEVFVSALDLPAYSGLRTRIYDAPTRLERIQVEVRTLDREFPSASSISFIKIDAEGGELGILEGATNVIDTLDPVVSFEFGANSIGEYGISVEDMANFWRDRPYIVHDILGRPLSREQFIASAQRQELWDYIALPASRAELVMQGWHRS